ncbi:MAG TPA: 2-amino-4-hydroxy-6-hydroxymethyldihydropteridine diphosphokinase [Bacteroidales bacterium]|jgi:2-amino-4-hydroxy-6-hydroxymethyldihydropteridine diphosphokinase|nr:2-amino-4-hydroxy-6-hydroxymethyldihydropteridine diphosphokinase [Bacteroidales bacterium]HOS15578.1 2-amino-4-hydroxy-6-hydroxymethyldihydropteridine diphosphokinase [Bacteroidales bacterium]
MENYNKVYLLAGGNLQNTAEKYQRLFALLENHLGYIILSSGFYLSEAWGYKSEYPFINLAICLHTKLSPEEVMQKTQHIEKLMGRDKKNEKTYTDRSMDIDIIFYNDLIMQTNSLQIPHPRMQERRFVLYPLCEIASEIIHPVLEKSVQQLKESCEDTTEVKIFSFTN